MLAHTLNITAFIAIASYWTMLVVHQRS